MRQDARNNEKIRAVVMRRIVGMTAKQPQSLRILESAPRPIENKGD